MGLSRTHDLRFIAAADRRLRRGQPGDGYAIGRAGDVIHSEAVTELDRIGFATMLAADADFQIGPGGAAQLHRHLNQFADAFLVENREWISLEDLQLLVVFAELRVVVAR